MKIFKKKLIQLVEDARKIHSSQANQLVQQRREITQQYASLHIKADAILTHLQNREG